LARWDYYFARLKEAKHHLDTRNGRQVKPLNAPETAEYTSMQLTSNAYGETNDCSVIALAMATDVDYETAHSAMERNGRVDGDVAYIDSSLRAARDLGWHPTQVQIKSKTVATAERELSHGRFLVCVRGHILAIVDGVCHDHTRQSRKRITTVYRLTEIS